MGKGKRKGRQDPVTTVVGRQTAEQELDTAQAAGSAFHLGDSNDSDSETASIAGELASNGDLGDLSSHSAAATSESQPTPPAKTVPVTVLISSGTRVQPDPAAFSPAKQTAPLNASNLTDDGEGSRSAVTPPPQSGSRASTPPIAAMPATGPNTVVEPVLVGRDVPAVDSIPTAIAVRTEASEVSHASNESNPLLAAYTALFNRAQRENWGSRSDGDYAVRVGVIIQLHSLLTTGQSVVSNTESTPFSIPTLSNCKLDINTAFNQDAPLAISTYLASLPLKQTFGVSSLSQTYPRSFFGVAPPNDTLVAKGSALVGLFGGRVDIKRESFEKSLHNIADAAQIVMAVQQTSLSL